MQLITQLELELCYDLVNMMIINCSWMFPYQMCLDDCFRMNFLVFYKASCLIYFLKQFKMMAKFWSPSDICFCFVTDLNVRHWFPLGFNSIYLKVRVQNEGLKECSSFGTVSKCFWDSISVIKKSSAYLEGWHFLCKRNRPETAPSLDSESYFTS